MGNRNIVVTKPTNPNKLEDELKKMEEQEKLLQEMCSDEYQDRLTEEIYNDLVSLAKRGLL